MGDVIIANEVLRCEIYLFEGVMVGLSDGQWRCELRTFP